jgi:hypothetical protein
MRTALYLFAIVASIGAAVVFLPLPDQAVSKTVCGIVDGLILGVTVWPYHSVLVAGQIESRLDWSSGSEPDDATQAVGFAVGAFVPARLSHADGSGCVGLGGGRGVLSLNSGGS